MIFDETSLELLTLAPGVNRLVSEADGIGGRDDLSPGCGDAHPTTATRAAATQTIESFSIKGSVLLGVDGNHSKERTEVHSHESGIHADLNCRNFSNPEARPGPFYSPRPCGGARKAEGRPLRLPAMQRVFTRLLDVLASSIPHDEVRTIFDVGARDCEESRQFALAFPNAVVYAFECNPATLPACRAVSAAEPRVVLTEMAASNHSGISTFYPIDQERTITGAPDGNPGASSLFRASGRYAEEQYVQQEIQVPTLRLDDFMRENSIDSVDILWMDVQGAEALVLEGLGNRLRDVRCLHIEVEFFEIYEDQGMFDDVDPYLRDRGFNLLGFTSYSRYAADALYLRDDIAVDSARMRNDFPYLSRNLGKMRTHRLKRSMRQLVGLPAWKESQRPRQIGM